MSEYKEEDLAAVVSQVWPLGHDRNTIEHNKHKVSGLPPRMFVVGRVWSNTVTGSQSATSCPLFPASLASIPANTSLVMCPTESEQ